MRDELKKQVAEQAESTLGNLRAALKRADEMVGRMKAEQCTPETLLSLSKVCWAVSAFITDESVPAAE